MAKELEVKVLGIDVLDTINKLEAVGGEFIGRYTQKNTIIDSSTNPISSYMDGYLRIREELNQTNGEQTIELTLKKRNPSLNIRNNTEFNVLIDSKETMINILSLLGFNKINESFKERISYRVLNARVDIDTHDKETYPESYMEIEVEKEEDLKEIVRILDIDEKAITTKSIRELTKDC